MKSIEIFPCFNGSVKGKTKVIFPATLGSADNSLRLVIVKSLDDITAGNGKRRVTMPGKGEVSNKTACNVFTYLNKLGVNTHFITEHEDDSFVAYKCWQIPVECVARRIKYGSWLKRNLGQTSGKKFRNVKIEFFLKDDAKNDPLIRFRNTPQVVSLHNPYVPVDDSDASLIEVVDKHQTSSRFPWISHVSDMWRITEEVFLLVEHAWQQLGITLVDFKLEFGIDQFGRLVVSDVIDNDSWRIWPGGDESKMLDKQVFRDDADPTPERLEQILENYRTVMNLTSKFV